MISRLICRLAALAGFVCLQLSDGAHAADGTWANVAPVMPALTFTSGSPDIAFTGTAPVVGDALRVNTAVGNFANNAAYFVVSVSGSTLQLSTSVGGAAQAANASGSSSAPVFRNWSDAANWNGGTIADGVGATATFSSLAANTRIALGGDITVGHINFTGGSSDLDLFGYDYISITGASLTFATGTAATPTFSIGRNATFPGNVSNARNMAVFGSQGLEIITSNDTSINFRPHTGIDWSGFSGGLQLRQGRMDVQAANVFPTGAGALDLMLGNANTSAGRFAVLNMSATRNQTIGALNGTNVGRISGSAGTAAVLTIGANDANGDFPGIIGADAAGSTAANQNIAIAKTGAGTQRLSGQNNYTGATMVSAGTLLVTGSIASPVTVNTGTFGGTGTSSAALTIGNNTGVADAILAPGDAAIGTFTAAGALTMRGDASFAVELDSNAGAIDKVVAGGVTLDGATLEVTDLGSTDLPSLTSLTIIDNTSASPVSGEFAGLPEGTLFVVGLNTFRITYAGGDGNDVAIVTPQAVPVINSPATASGVAETAFSYQITATNSPTSFNATGLPGGLSIDTATGVISGSVFTPGTYGIGLEASNALGTSSITLTLTIEPHPDAAVVTSPATSEGGVGTPFVYQLTATNLPATITVSGLPAGLSFDSSTGIISGTPTAYGTFVVTITTDNGHLGVTTLTLTIVQPAFAHPGVFWSQADLDRMRTKVAAGEEPWLSGYIALAADPRSSSSYALQGPKQYVGRNTPSGIPDNRAAFENDGAAVLHNALMWCITGDQAHADKAIQILDTWTDPNEPNHLIDFIGADRRLLAGIEGMKWIGGAEILRHTGAGWSGQGIANFSAMLRNIMYPVTRQYGGGNWGTSGMGTNVAMGVFLDDHEIFDEAVVALQVGGRTQCDNSISTYIAANGQNSETDRDQAHSQLGVAHLVAGAEIAWQQGVDLYSYLDNRLLTGMEYLATYNLGLDVPFTPSVQCDGFFNHSISDIARGELRPIYEMVWNHYENRIGIEAPMSQQAALATRPEGYNLDHLGFGTILFVRDARDPALPLTPHGLASIADDGQVDLLWSAAPGATGYNVKRATARGGPFTTVAAGVTTTSYADATVENEKLHYYAVSAVNAAGETIDSALSIAFPTASAPAAPLGVTAVAANASRIDVSWNASLGATGYEVKRASSSGGPFVTVATVEPNAYRSFGDAGLSAGTTYFYVVTALNAIGESESSSVVSATTLQTLPSPWTASDVGLLTTPGQTVLADGTFTVKAAGLDIGGENDSFHFVHAPLVSDGAITARIASRINYSQLNKTGLMMRETLAKGSRDASVLISGSGVAQFASRSADDAFTSFVSGASDQTFPRWLRLTRSGDRFTGYVSVDGFTWSQVHSRTFDMAATLETGMAMASRNNAVLDTATFDSVNVTSGGTLLPVITSALDPVTILINEPYSYTVAALNGATSFSATGLPPGLTIDPVTGVISGAPTAAGAYPVTLNAVNAAGATQVSLALTVTALPPPWLDLDIGPVATAGGASHNDGTFVISGAGTDVTANPDQLHYAYQSLSGDGVIIARLVDRVTGGNATNDKVGIMMRQSTATNSPVAILMIENNRARFASRPGSPIYHTAEVSPVSIPVWLKLERTGDTFAGSVSSDGTTWTPVSSFTTTMSETITAGMFVCSRDAAALNTSTFDNVSVAGVPIVTSPTAAAAPLNQPFSYAITATNSPTSFAASDLPARLSLDPATGVISGTPTAVGSTTVTLTASNVAGTATATLLLQVAELPVFSVNLKTSAATGMTTVSLAGVERVDHWNNLVGPANSVGSSVSLATPMDHTGAVYNMPVTVTAGSSGGMSLRFAEGGNDQTLYATVLDHWNGTAGSLSITDVPFPTYDLVFHVFNDGAARGGRFTVGDTTYYIRTGVANPTSTGAGYIRSTDTNSGYGAGTQQGNYVRFTGLSGDLSATFVALNMGDSVQRLKIAGFQLIATSLPLPDSAAPGAPTGLVVTAGDGQVELTWNAAAGANSYTVKRGMSPGGPFTTIASGITTTAYTDASAANGTTYYYVVSAGNAAGESADSASSEAATPTAPSPPVAISFDLRAANSSSMEPAHLAGAPGARFANWNGFVGPSGGGQTVSTSAPIVDSDGAAVTGMTVTLVSGSAGSTHDRVNGLSTPDDPRMFNSVLDQWNGTASTVTITGVPYANYDAYVYIYGDESASNANDRGGRVTVGDTTYFVRTGTATRVAATDGSGYIQSTDTNATVGMSTQLGNYVRFTGLSGDLSASFVALNFGGGAQRLKVAGFQIVAPNGAPAVTTPPAAPIGIVATAAPGQVTVRWSPSNTATSYIIKRATDASGPFAEVGTTTALSNSFVDTAVTNGTTYFYVVSASNAVGTSADSAPASVTPIDPLTLAAFSVNLRAFNTYGMPVTDAAGVVRLGNWNNLVGPSSAGDTVSTSSLTDHLGIPLSGVSVTWVPGSSSGTVKLGGDAVTVGPASNDLNLYSSVFDQFDGTPGTLTVTGIPFSSYDVLFYVRDDGATRGGMITANGSTLAIRGGAGNPDANGTGYVRSTDAVNTSGSSVQQGNYVRFAGLSGDLAASFVATNVGSSVQRLKIAGFQVVSNESVPVPTSAPAAPAGFTASGGNQQVGLNWSLSPTATAYRIYRDGSLLATVAYPLTSYADTAVVNGNNYSYAVTAMNGVGESAPSPAAPATPAAPAFTAAQRSVYQYSIPMTPIFGTWTADPQRRAYLWVPPGTTRLQGVLIGLHNMLEKPLFDDPAIRAACAAADLGIIFISPGDSKTWTPNGVGNYTPGPVTTAIDLDPNNYKSADINPTTGTNYATDIDPATGTRFASQTEQAGAEVGELLNLLAAESGYAELSHAPLMLVGHSAASPFTWIRGLHNTAALSGRVFALLPYKGTFPGSIPGGMPVLHVASEWQEISNWGNTWELGDAPATRNLRAGGADRLLSAFVQPGTGHYQYSETQSGPLALFIQKAAQARIPAAWSPDSAPTLNSIDPASGVLVDVTRTGSGNGQPVAYADWVGAGKNPVHAYWYFDAEMAQAVCDAQNAGFSKRPQMINGFQNATTLAPLASQNNGTGNVSLSATLLADGVSFQVRAASLNQSPVPRLFHGGPLGMAGGPILFKANGSGALKQTGPDTFQVWMDRGTVIKQGQPWEPFVIAHHPGDADFREADRPIWLNTSAPVNNINGAAQTITFPDVPDQRADQLVPVSLEATASSGLPVQYWVVSGPYRNDEYDSSVLIPDQLPAGAAFPIRVIVGAWQWGRPGTTAAAPIVYEEFFIQAPPPPAITSSTTTSGSFGSPFEYVIAATESPTGYSATGLPLGLDIDTATGAISGVPAVSGEFLVELGATNLGGTGTATLTLSIAKAPASITLDSLAHTFDGSPKSATATSDPAGLAIEFTYDGSVSAPVNAGSYAVIATINDANHAGSASGTLVIARATAAVTLGDLSHVFDGSAKSASATTSPAGLNVVLSYDGSATAPTNAGSHAVLATIDETNYAGSASGTLIIAQAPAEVVLSDLSRTYDGSPKSATATTTPAGLAVSITYDGSLAAPTGAGSYALVATITDPNHSGSGSGTLVIAKAAATIALAGLDQRYDGTPRVVTAATGPEGLAVNITYDGGSIPPVYPGSYDIAAAIDDANHSGSVSDTLVVSITGLVRHMTSLNGGIDGSVQVLTAENVTLNSAAWISGDLLVPGTPNLVLNGHPTYVGTLDGPGAATPAGHTVTLNGAVLRHLVRRIDPLALPTVAAPPQPAGTRSVSINNSSQSPGDFATLRNLTLNSNVGLFAIPSGSYGSFIANKGSGFVLGVAGASEPAIYSLQDLTLNGGSRLEIVGPVILTLNTGTSIAKDVTTTAHPFDWFMLRIASGGLSINGDLDLPAIVVAPNGTVSLNSTSSITGEVYADRLTINSNALLRDPAP